MKIYNSLYKLIIRVFIIALIYSFGGYPQNKGILDYQYLSPEPGSSMNSPKTNIIIRYGTAYSSEDVFGQYVLEVSGEKSGFHSGEIILTEDNKTLLFEPKVPFQEGELVNVKLLKPIRAEDNNFIPMLNFNFGITEHDLNDLIRNKPEKYLLTIYSDFENQNPASIQLNLSGSHRYTVMQDSLPEGFPHIEIDSLNNPYPGFIFLTPYNFFNPGNNYLIILDNYGIPVFYRYMPYFNFDFKKQPTGGLTYYDQSKAKFFVLNSFYNVTDSLIIQNGYLTDVHELLLLENHHSLMMGMDFQYVGMDTVVPGGNPHALVVGLILQEQDQNKNVVFQWRSWDHFKITDATYDIDLTDTLIDYAHGNAIDVDNDGNLLLSCRHMDEITKLDRQTGNIIWRWGGEYCKNNQFTFINDPIGFSHQHDIRRLENGNLTVFDNGNLHSPPFSRVAEYQMDEVNKLAFLIWEYKNDPVSFSFAMGNARRLPNHNTIIGWGTCTSPSISEVKPDANVSLFLTIPDTLVNYRGFKYSWKTNLFVGNPESLFFGYVSLGDSLELPLEIINNSNQLVEINDLYNRESEYSTDASLPIFIPPFSSENITVKFKPDIDGDYFDDLHLRWDIEGQRIAQVIPLIGSTDPNFTTVETENGVQDYYLSQNYPNPFNPSTKIRYSIPSVIASETKQSQLVILKVYDILGNEVATLVNEEKLAGSYEVNFNAASLSSGIYFYKIRAGSFVETKKMILMK